MDADERFAWPNKFVCLWVLTSCIIFRCIQVYFQLSMAESFIVSGGSAVTKSANLLHNVVSANTHTMKTENWFCLTLRHKKWYTENPEAISCIQLSHFLLHTVQFRTKFKIKWMDSFKNSSFVYDANRLWFLNWMRVNKIYCLICKITHSLCLRNQCVCTYH